MPQRIIHATRHTFHVKAWFKMILTTGTFLIYLGRYIIHYKNFHWQQLPCLKSIFNDKVSYHNLLVSLQYLIENRFEWNDGNCPLKPVYYHAGIYVNSLRKKSQILTFEGQDTN